MRVKSRPTLLKLAINWLAFAWFVKWFWLTCLSFISLQFAHLNLSLAKTITEKSQEEPRLSTLGFYTFEITCLWVGQYQCDCWRPSCKRRKAKNVWSSLLERLPRFTQQTMAMAMTITKTTATTDPMITPGPSTENESKSVTLNVKDYQERKRTEKGRHYTKRGVGVCALLF